MARLERRPMEQEERAAWQRAMKNTRERHRVCACGKSARRLLGSLESGTWYCDEDFAVAKNKAAREAMRTM
jgi:hypothetical protein